MNKRILRCIATVGLSMAVVLSFQNCSPVHMEFVGTPSASVKSDGNGGTYDGKPAEGLYVRQHLNGCSNSMFIGRMQVTSTQSHILSDLCTDMNYSIDFSDPRLLFSQYNRDYIGFNSAIFEAEEMYYSAPSPVELWCRHSQPDSGIDVVVKSSGRGFLYRGENLGTPREAVYPRQSLDVRTSRTADSIAISSTMISGSVDLRSNSSGIFSAQMTFAGANLSMRCHVLSRDPAVYSLPNSLIAMYQMDGTAGALANGTLMSDSSRNSLDATLQNSNNAGAARISDGRFAQALRFDGRDDYVDMSPLARRVGSEFTVSMHIRPSLSIPDDRVAFAINTNAGSNVIKVGTGMCSGAGDRMNLSLELGNVCFDTGRAIVDGQWHAVAVTYSGGRVTLYLDGVAVESQAAVRPPSPTDLWSLGTDFDAALTPNDFWLGDIDEVTVWSVALPSVP